METYAEKLAELDEGLAKIGAIIKRIEEMTGWTDEVDETENEKCMYCEW